MFDEIFAYDAQGRITMQRRGANAKSSVTFGGEYSYEGGTNKLKSVASGMGGTADERTMSDTANFVYDSVGNLTYDKSKEMKILYDWRGMPIEFIQQSQPADSSSDTLFRLLMKYDGTGRRISKTVMHKVAGAADWDTAQVTHYTGIGTEIRENYAGPAKQTKVVVNMPQGLGRYGIEDAENPDMGSGVGYIPNAKFEWYLKNHLGSTMLVYGTQADANPAHSDIGTPLATYDYRAFGEMIELLPPPTGKVTENFTGSRFTRRTQRTACKSIAEPKNLGAKRNEHDDEISLDYFGARYLDPMLGMWVSVDPARQFASPYLYTGNGMNPVNVIDPDGKAPYQIAIFLHNLNMLKANPDERLGDDFQDFHAVERWGYSEFGDDFAIRIVRNQNEMINFVKEGEYTAIVGHTWQGEEGMLFNRTRGPSDELNLNELDEALMGSDSFAKVFGCKTEKWNVEFSQIEYGGNEGKLPMGEAYKEAGRYLTEGWNTDRRLETIKPTTSDE